MTRWLTQGRAPPELRRRACRVAMLRIAARHVTPSTVPLPWLRSVRPNYGIDRRRSIVAIASFRFSPNLSDGYRTRASAVVMDVHRPIRRAPADHLAHDGGLG